jgi:ABC-type uncharacterized transport system fused permease/ATPase subunit
LHGFQNLSNASHLFFCISTRVAAERALIAISGPVVVGPQKKAKVAVNQEFFNRLGKLFKIVMPSWTSREAILLYTHSACLVARTFLSIYVARLDSTLVKTIVDRNGWGFAGELVKWLTIAIPSTYINSMLRFLESSLATAFRTRLTEHCHKYYFNRDTYYRCAMLPGTSLPDADQCMTGTRR